MRRTITVTFEVENSGDEIAVREFQDGSKAFSALAEIAAEVFRPARKHGYEDDELRKLMEIAKSDELVGLLEKKFYEILRDRGIDL